MTVVNRKSSNILQITSPEQLEAVVEERNFYRLHIALKNILFSYKDLYIYLNERVLNDWILESSKAKFLGNLMEVSESTIYRWKNSVNVVKESHADRLSQLIELYTYGEEVLGSEAAFKEWLNQANLHFNGEAPITRLDNFAGVKFIGHLLDKIEYGAPV
jgi:uncharacterized protein (DUF2384 family)